MLKTLSTYLDSRRLICHRNEDGSLDCGDSCQRTYMYGVFRFVLSQQKIYWFNFLESLDSAFWLSRCPVRSPQPGWWSLPDRFSRDQLIPMIVGKSFIQHNEQMKLLTVTMLKRLGLCWNWYGNGDAPTKKLPDILGPTTWTAILRYWTSRYLITEVIFWPLICALDLFLILQVLFRCIVMLIDSDNVGDDLNLTLLVLHAKYFSPTLASLAARKIFKHIRKPCLSFQWYFRDESAPPIDEPSCMLVEEEL